MERLTVLLIALAGCMSVTSAEFNCARIGTGETFPTQVCYVEDCAKAIRDHIQNEFNAAFKYMYMGAYFAQDSVDRPGLAKFLLESASEERGHAIQMLDYLNLRGIQIDSNLTYTFNTDSGLSNVATTYDGALKEAINMEIEVTKMIYDVVDKCEKDFHGADVFTNPILDEQHNGMRKLQGAMRAFKDLLSGHGEEQDRELAEYIFDRKMLSGEF